jgi:VWFA-related protein
MSSKIRTAVLLATLALSWFSALPKGAAQEQSKPDETTVRVSTALVQIDVGVKDQKGNLVRDLRREDFEVLEDGKPQPLTHFAVGTASRAAVYLDPTRSNSAKPAERAAVTPEGRYLVLAVDDYHLVAENLAAVKSALALFVEHELAPGDKVALTATSGAMNLNQQFTSSRRVILRAISQLSLQDRTGNDAGGVPNLSDYQAELIEQGDQGALQIAVEELRIRKGKPVRGNNTSRPIGLSNPNDAEESLVRAKAHSIVTQNDYYTALTFASLETSIRGLRQLPGRKILMLLSDGFFTGEGRKFNAYDIRRITDAATRAGVVIYSIDARGLVARPTLGSASDRQNATITLAPDARRRVAQGEIRAKIDGLYTLAKETGGLPFYNNNDLGAGLKRVLDDTEFYYVLAYETTNTMHDGRFRKIEVRVASRPGLTMQTRAGYYASMDEAVEAATRKKEKPKKPVPEVAETKINRYRAALNSLIPLRGIPFDLGVHFIHTPATNSLAMITARIDASSLRLEQEGNILEVVGLILDESGKSVSNFHHTFELKGGDGAPAQVQQKPFNYHNLVPLGPGTYQVRLVVADGEMRRVGSAAEWIEIPELKEKSLALSSIFLTEEGKDLADIYDAFAATLQPQEAKKNSGTPAANTLQPVRRFKRGTNLDFLLFAYNAQTNPQGVGNLSIRIKVLAGGKAIYTSPPSGVAVNTEHAQQGFPCVARLPLSTYDPGDYELQIEVSDQTAKLTATRSINFSID